MYLCEKIEKQIYVHEFPSAIYQDCLDKFLRIAKNFANFEKFEKFVNVYWDPIKNQMRNGPNSDNPWKTLVHYDVWTNNMLFHGEKENKIVDSVKLIDFQLLTLESPLADLVFFVITSSSFEISNEKLDSIFDLYYDLFISYIQKVNCSQEHYTREKFDERLKIDALKELPHLVVLIYFITFVENDESFYAKRVEKLMSFFAYKKWVD